MKVLTHEETINHPEFDSVLALLFDDSYVGTQIDKTDPYDFEFTKHQWIYGDIVNGLVDANNVLMGLSSVYNLDRYGYPSCPENRLTIFIHPDYRNHGFGRWFALHVIDLNKVGYISVAKTNEDSVRLFDSLHLPAKVEGEGEYRYGTTYFQAKNVFTLNGKNFLIKGQVNNLIRTKMIVGGSVSYSPCDGTFDLGFLRGKTTPDIDTLLQQLKEESNGYSVQND